MKRRITNVVRMEWAGIAATPSSLLFLVVIPLILVGQALFLSWVVPRFVNPEILGPAGGNADTLRLLILRQFPFFVLLIPAMVANVFATLGIVEEKVSRTLEPLLATPVRTWELLTGKILSGAVPGLVVAWLSAGLFIAAGYALGWGALLRICLTPTFYLSLFLLMPAVSLLSFVIGVIGSSRARDAKEAQNLAMVVVLPIFAIIGLQVTGLVEFTPLRTLFLSLSLAAVDILLLRVAVRLFGRESIVTRWA
ncbi:MAG: ABC transporter permease [Candidatus Bipolaricaulis sp.]|nr:ABC transporter permease [Candidatus Bipolaricaulis sp.]MDD5219298.1 ABC transporter permease [Candidatus Bipolaricaulis sp.]